MSAQKYVATVIAIGVVAVSLAAQQGQAPAPPAPGAAPAGDVLGVGTYIHLVSDVNASIAFYSEVLGAMPNGRGNAPAGPRQYAPNDVVSNLYNTPGSQFRGGTIRVAGSELGGVELVDWQAPDRKRVQPRIQDPGAATLVLTVRDIDALSAALAKNGGAILTPGAKPVIVDDGKTRMILGRDPDGFLIAAEQPPATPETTAQTSNIVGASLLVTVGDLDRAARVYRDALGFHLESDAPPLQKTIADLTGLRGATIRCLSAVVPGTVFPITLVQFQGVRGQPLSADVHGIGASVLRLRVKDIDQTMAKLKGAGITVASANGQSVTFANGQRMAIMNDPNGIFVQPVQAAPPQPPRGE